MENLRHIEACGLWSREAYASADSKQGEGHMPPTLKFKRVFSAHDEKRLLEKADTNTPPCIKSVPYFNLKSAKQALNMVIFFMQIYP